LTDGQKPNVSDIQFFKVFVTSVLKQTLAEFEKSRTQVKQKIFCLCLYLSSLHIKPNFICGQVLVLC